MATELYIKMTVFSYRFAPSKSHISSEYISRLFLLVENTKRRLLMPFPYSSCVSSSFYDHGDILDHCRKKSSIDLHEDFR